MLGLDRRDEQALENALSPVFHDVEAAAADTQCHEREGKQPRHYETQVVLRARLHVFHGQAE